MAKVTSKLQVTLPKAIATEHGIRPGDEIEWLSGGDSIRVVPARRRTDIRSRLTLFDDATSRIGQLSQASGDRAAEPAADRGWSRSDLYDRPRPR